MSHRIFISLTKRDTPIAEALRDALVGLFGSVRVQVDFSTSKEVGRAPGHGEDWFKWIVDQVSECELAYILVTPNSIQKPWIPWEAGAVFGAAMASGAAGLNKVRPIVYQLSADQVPSPIASSKANYERGDNKKDIETMLMGLVSDYLSELGPRETAEIVNKLEEPGGVVDAYIERVRTILKDARVVPTSGVVEEWRIRLDRLLEEDRGSEVDQFEDWLDIAFGKGSDDEGQALDLRLHSRLADLYLEGKQPQKAMRQLELALQLMPRDIFLLRRLGQAHLAANDMESAEETIDRIEELDARAFERNPECAALKGKWRRLRKEPAAAEEVYLAAYLANRRSYYLADLLAQVRLDQGKLEPAREAYRWALEAIKSLTEANIWAHATAANAAFFTNDDDRAALHLETLRGLEPRPTPREIEAIGQGIRRLAAKLDDGDARASRLLEVLRSQP